MLVSICIPVYNGEKTIVETLQAVMNQTYEEMEVIVVDNCSEDKTYEIVQNLQKVDDRIRLYRNESNLGMAGNWNECLKHVQGEYVHFVCADDILRKDCIEKKMNLVEKESDIVMVFSASEIINDNGEMIMSRHEFKYDCCVDGQRLAKKSYHQKNLFGEPSNVLIKKRIIDKVGEFARNTFYATDWDMWIRVASQGKVGYINLPLMQYRISAQNETSKYNFKKFLEDDSIMMKNLEEYNCIPIYWYDKVIHRVFYFGRMVARYMYMKIKC